MAPPEHPGLRDLREIGRGGFGVVYRAWQPGLDRDVAVKLLTARPDEQVRLRFAQECRALGQLSGHPHIVDVHDGGFRADGQAFLVMPYLDSGSLAARLKRHGALPWSEAVDIAVRLAGALQTAHDAGILHRDLKPANVLLDDYGAPRLADFGQARLGDTAQTRTGETAITPGFTAPEVLNGDRATVQSDVYGLGSTVLALIMGQPPFETGGDLMAMFYRVVTEPPPDVRRLGVPDPVAAALERALAKQPAARYASAEEFGADLQAAQRRLGLAPSPLVVARRPAAALPPVAFVATDPALPVTPPVGSGGSASAPFAGPGASRYADPGPDGPPYAGPGGPWPGSFHAAGPGPPSWSGPGSGPQARPDSRPPPARRPPTPRRWLGPVAVVLALVALGGGGAVLVRELTGPPSGTSAQGDPSSTSASDGTASTSDPLTAPVTSTAPSTIPPPPPGQADVSAVSGDPDAVAVGQTLSAYFLGVNARDFPTAYAVFSPDLRGRIGFDQWAEGLGTTLDSAVVVVGIERTDGALLAQARFTSEQAPEDGPVAGETCSKWTLTYTLVPNVDGPAPFQIAEVDDVGPGHTAC